ncbi:MAG: AzlD domain-containing protein [Proteobacteria bacterium]|nr:AzlD domain-containing protein [Pseudomonadota bacterium]
MAINIFLAILVTSLATFLSRFLGFISSVKIKETSKLFRWFNCLAYSTLAAVIARTVIFPVGVLEEATYLSRFLIVFPIYQICLLVTAFIFGEFSFFWKFFKKMMKRFKLKNS